ncbi:twin-arginine translocation signal domain-containing protein [Mycobacterium sp. NPDC050441]
MSRREVLKCAAAAPALLGLGTGLASAASAASGWTSTTS